MKIAIIGIGAMGCLLASRLTDLAEVVMGGNWLTQIEALNRRGLKVQHPDGRETLHQVRATDDRDDLLDSDLALIVVKSPKTAPAADLAAHALKREGLALTLQNGLGNLEVVAEAVGPERAALGVTSEGATLLAPGLVRHAGAGLTYLARSEATAVRLEKVYHLFQQAGFETKMVDNPASLQWGKLAVNAGINPLTALLQVPNGFLAEHESVRHLMFQAAREVEQVAGAQQIQLPYEDVAQRALTVAQATASNHSSMAQDIARRAPTEIEAICGAVVRYGRLYDVPTPINETLLRLVQSLEIKQSS